MKKLKLFFALFAMLALGVGNAWGATYFEDNFSNVGTGTNSFSSRTGWTSLTQCYPQYNTGVRIGSGKNAGAITKKAMTEISGTKDLKVTIYTAKYNSDANSFTITTTNGTITSATGVGTLSNGTLTVKPSGNAGVTTTTSKATWTDNYKTEFIISGASSNTTIKFATNKRAILGPIKIEDAVSEGGDVTEDLGDALKWSADAATVQMGADDNVFPTLTNDKNVEVTYTSSSAAVATIDANGVVALVKEGTTTISAYYEGGEIEGVTYSAKNVSYTLTVNPAPLVIEPIEGGIIDILTHKTLAATSSSYANFTGKQAANENHSDAVYAGRSARNGNATQYSIQLNTIDKGRIATTTTGGLAKRVYVKWSTQATLNTNARELYIYGSNTAFTGSESTAPSTKIGTIKYTTGAAEAYVDLTGDYKYILMTGSAAIYMDEIQVTWVSAAGTVISPTINGAEEFVESTEVSITAEDGYKVYYTTNGDEPTNESTEYTAPFSVTATTTVKAIAYDGAAKSEVVSKTLKALEILTCEAAAEKCAATESTDKYVVRGYVTSIPYPYSATNTTPTFWMADTKDGGNVMQAYKVTPLEEADKAVIVGDQVQVIGKIKLYNSTPEFNGGTYTITVPNPKYNVDITSAHGTVTATPASAVEGAEVTLSVEVESGWVFQSWTVTDASSNPIEVVDNKFTMPASDVTVVANYTESVAPDAVLTLMANGNQHSQETYKVGETVELPDNIANDCVKMFVGWSADASCATAPEYAPGADFTLTAEEHTLYAVYANGTTGETVTIKHNSTETTNMTGNNDANKFFGLDAAAWSIKGDKGGNSNNVGLNKDGTIRLYYAAAGGNTLTITAPSKVATIKLTYNGTLTKAWVKVNGNKVTPTDGVYTIDAETFVIGNANAENVQVHIKNIAVTLAGALADFSTTCSAALANPTFSLTEGKYTEAKSVEITATEGTIYYTTDGTEPTASSTQYTAAIALNDCGEYTIKAIAISSDSQSDVVSATYTIKLPLTNSQAAPYTEAEAIAVYDGGCYDNLDVYVKGTVKTATFNSTYGNYTITLTNGFQFYRFLQAAETKFTEDIIVPGDVLVACGKLSKYETTYQLAEGCYLVERIPYEGEKTDISNTEATAYTVDKAFELIADVSSDLTKEVYVKGLVAVAPTSNPTADGQMTYSISDNGENTGNVLKVYLGLNLNGEKFTSKNDVQQGDYVVVKGKLLDYNSTYELNKGNQLVQHVKAATIKIADITMEVGETKTIAATITPDAAKTEVAYSIKENAANAISLSGNVITANAVGTATITATIATATDYMGKTIDFTVTVNAKSTKEKVVILAQYDGKWYAMTNECTDSKQMGAIEVNYKNGVLFDVDESTKASITWELAIADGKATFKNNDKYLIGGNSTTLNYANSKFEWVVDGDKYLSDNKSRTFLYNKSGIFKNYATSNAEPTQTDYSGYPVVAAPNYGMTTADVVANSYFSVADGKFVQFSTGNLQYEVGTNTWSFAAKQYEVIGGEAYTGSNNTNFGMNEPGYTGKLDLFAWSCDGKFGVNPSNADADYTGTFADWGNLVNEEGWYTLTKDEMNYLLNRKKDGKKLWALATVCGMNGLILLPDNWNKETELEYGYVPADWNYTKNQFDATAWAALEAAGAVFLPEGGTRVGGHGNKEQGGGPAEFDAHGDYFHVDNVGEMGYYWLNTQDTRTGFENCASYLILPGWSEGATDADNDDICLQPQVWSREKRRGNSVRLVKEVTPDSYYTRTVTSGDYGTICLPNGGLLLGASAFSVAKMEGTTILLDEVGTTMVAGTPYVVFPNTGATNLYVFYTDNANAPAGNANGLYGSYTRDELAPNAGNYIMLPGNKYAEVTGSGVFVAAKRAYFKVSEISTTAPAPAPGVRRIAIGQAPQVATGMENIDASAQPVKTIINGQLFILRGEKMYDAQGKLVK